MSNHALAERSRAFKQRVNTSASRILTEWVGPERAKEATGRIASAFSASALAARDASDFYACTPESVALCVATAALTGIMPSSGAAALAYLIPRRPRKNDAPHLNYQLSHRGLAALARRAGLVLIPIPVGGADIMEIRDGEVSRLEPDPDDPPMDWEDLRGIVCIVKDIESGSVLFRGWMPKKLIAKRRQMSDSFKWAEKKGDWAKDKSTWHRWPIEMAMKTAMHYAVSRGWAVIDDTEAVRALSIDATSDVINAEFVDANTDADATGAAALGLDETQAETKALEDNQAARDIEDESMTPNPEGEKLPAGHPAADDMFGAPL